MRFRQNGSTCNHARRIAMNMVSIALNDFITGQCQYHVFYYIYVPTQMVKKSYAKSVESLFKQFEKVSAMNSSFSAEFINAR